MIAHQRPVRFDEVDAAGILFFGCFAAYAHEAKEQLFRGIDGGYHGAINERKIGFPVVRFHCDFKAPLRYGDVAQVEVRVARVGERSAELGFRVLRTADQVLSATLEMTFVVTDLRAMRSCAMPADVRRVLVQHLAEGASD